MRRCRRRSASRQPLPLCRISCNTCAASPAAAVCGVQAELALGGACARLYGQWSELKGKWLHLTWRLCSLCLSFSLFLNATLQLAGFRMHMNEALDNPLKNTPLAGVERAAVHGSAGH